MSQGRAAIFLDKDGTLIPDVPYNVDPHLIRLSPGAGEGLARLAGLGFPLVVVSNQSGVARGLFSPEALGVVEERLGELLAPWEVRLAGFRFCPHHPRGSVPEYTRECDCRKPAPGMLIRAAAEAGYDLGRSWMIGDTLNDVEAGQRAGCRTVLLENGGESEWRLGPARLPHHRVPDLDQAARVVEALHLAG